MNKNQVFSTQRKEQSSVNAVANNIGGKSSGFNVMDNRPATVAQRKQITQLQTNRSAMHLDSGLTQGIIQRATKMQPISTGNYKYHNDTLSEVAGKHAEAYLDPSSPANGSGPSSSALQGAMEDLKTLGYQSMIKGHLLNGQLGGPGVAENLYPITSSANSKHKNFAENVIKSHVSKGGHHGVYYSVEVTEANYSSKHPSAKFTCEAYLWNKHLGQTHAAVDRKSAYLPPLDIESTPVKGSTGFGHVQGLLSGYNAFGDSFSYASNTPTSMSFPTKKLPAGWGEIGSGRGSGGRDWSHVSGMDMS